MADYTVIGLWVVHGEKRQRAGRTPGRFAHAGAMVVAPAFWSAAALRRFPGQARCASVIQAFASFDSSPKIVAEAEVDFAIELVKANMGIAMMPRQIAEKKPGTCRIAIVKPVVEGKIGLIWCTGLSLSPHAEAWRKLAEEWTMGDSVKIRSGVASASPRPAP